MTEFKTGDRVRGFYRLSSPEVGEPNFREGVLYDRTKDQFIRPHESIIQGDEGPHDRWYVDTDTLELVESVDPPETPRGSVLLEARDLITGDRNKTYGSPTQNFQDTADIWDTLLKSKLKEDARIEPGDVARLMIALKLCRMVAQPKRDNWTDIAGYAGCGYEVEAETGKIQE
jgi:hypothetical protein